MDHHGLKLTRRPLLTIGPTPLGEADNVAEPAESSEPVTGSDLVSEGIREPHKADRVTNTLRRITDRFGGRRFDRSGYNRKQRDLYKRRIPQRAGQSSEKRLAPPKYMAGRLRAR